MEAGELRANRPDLIRTLIDEEIRRIVADAIRDGGCLNVSAAAAQIRKTYPKCGLKELELINNLALAAARSGVAVEFDKDQAA